VRAPFTQALHAMVYIKQMSPTAPEHAFFAKPHRLKTLGMGRWASFIFAAMVLSLGLGHADADVFVGLRGKTLHLALDP